MLITARDIISRYGNPEEKFLREALAGNICRCTGYAGIVKAVQHAAGQITKTNQDVAAASRPATALR
jgi:carbon-monoxide dehydrogenase small subunit